MTGIVAYGAYVPHWRLRREAIAAALGGSGARGTRAVAAPDQDTTTLGFEAARRAIAAAGERAPDVLAFATTAPAYADKTNATAIHAALALPSSTSAVDCCGAVRSASAALTVAHARHGLAVLADMRTGLPGSADEAAGGDAAVAFVMGPDEEAVAVLLGSAAACEEFTDRWRTPGDSHSTVWEERFGEHAYLPLAQRSFEDALKVAGISVGELDRVIVTGVHARAVAATRTRLGCPPELIADDLTAVIGNTGCAHAGLLLAGFLDEAQPGQTVAVVTLADGCETTVWKATERVTHRRPALPLRQLVEAGDESLPYATFLRWRGMLAVEPPRRPAPDRPAAPPSLRNREWKYGLAASRDETGFVYAPPARVSLTNGEIDNMRSVRLADRSGTIATFTVDYLAYSVSGPVAVAVVDFDGGGRLQCELTDVDPERLAIGDRVEMTFRRLWTEGGVHNYFWKAKPQTAAVEVDS